MEASRASPALWLTIGLSACGGAAAEAPSIHTTHSVVINGSRANTLAETIEGPVHGHVFVRAHDGRELWVRESDISELAIAPDSWVLVADRGGIVPAQVIDT